MDTWRPSTHPKLLCRHSKYIENPQSKCRISRVIPRLSYQQTLERALRRAPIVALIGPRQCGKTTLARQFLPPEHINYFDLEDPLVASLMENPKTLLEGLRGLVVIDEAQREPRLFPVLRVLADRVPNPSTFLILGSASPELSRQSSESAHPELSRVLIASPKNKRGTSTSIRSGSPAPHGSSIFIRRTTIPFPSVGFIARASSMRGGQRGFRTGNISTSPMAVWCPKAWTIFWWRGGVSPRVIWPMARCASSRLVWRPVRRRALPPP